VLALAGAATLGGQLTVRLINGFEPPPGTSFNILTAASISGEFGATDLPALADHNCWELTYHANAATLTVLSPARMAEQPSDQREICFGGTATFTASAMGYHAPSYRWRNEGVELSDGGHVAGATTPTLTISPVTHEDAGSYDVVVTNSCGTDTSQSVALTVETTPPVITLNGPGELYLQCSIDSYIEQGAAATDNCDGTHAAVVGGDTVDPHDCRDYTITYNAVDSAGNVATQVTRLVHVWDTIPPVINNLPNDLTVECEGPGGVPQENLTIAAFLNMPTASDACDPAVSVANNAPEFFPLGDTVVTWSARDKQGNPVQASRTVHVVDTTPPTITCPAKPAAMSADEHCQATVPDLVAGTIATDICGASVSVTQDPPAGTTVTIGDTLVTLTANDGNGNTATCQVTVSVVDTNPPTITCPPTPALISANESCQATIPDLVTGTTASDNCDTEVSISQNPPAGTLVGLGDTMVTLTARDNSGLTATCQVSISVVDMTPPTITCPANPAPITADEHCQAGIPDLVTTAKAADNCDNQVAVTQNPLAGTLVGLGDTVVILMADDGHGNTATCQVTVTVVDTTPPTITCPPGLTVVWADGNCQGVIPDLMPAAIATDNCDTAVAITQDPLPGTMVGLGDVVVTLTATDHVGLTATCQVTVTVLDTDADGDGVTDCLDRCSHTVPGAAVDENGCPPVIPGDFDRDGDVDSTDLEQFRACVTGPAILQNNEVCAGAKLDTDGDVDQADFGIFQRCYSGADKPADPNCAN